MHVGLVCVYPVFFPLDFESAIVLSCDYCGLVSKTTISFLSRTRKMFRILSDMNVRHTYIPYTGMRGNTKFRPQPPSKPRARFASLIRNLGPGPYAIQDQSLFRSVPFARIKKNNTNKKNCTCAQLPPMR